jgi:hypothetical protein
MRTSAVDTRAVFFLVAAALAFVLTPVADPEHRWVAIATGTTYIVLALLAALDGWSRSKEQDK